MDFVKSADSLAESCTAVQPRSASGPPPVTFIHLSDFHLCRVKDAKLPALFNKRLLSVIAWYLHRAKENLPRVLAPLAQAIQSRSWDQLVVTGDLSHLGLQEELAMARRFLARLAPAEKLFVVPGNHDALVDALSPHSPLWVAQANGSAADLGRGNDMAAKGFPLVRVQGRVAFIGLSSAQPTLPFSARGRLGETQRINLARHLMRYGAQGFFRVVAVHHPVLAGQLARRKQLADREALAKILQRHGAELVLHGHAHRDLRGALQGSTGTIPVFGIPSASSVHLAPTRRACFRRFSVSPTAEGWEICLENYRLNPSAEAFVLAGQERLRLKRDMSIGRLGRALEKSQGGEQ
jgi:3',5'-cyclic AMP phosphodiesterase CpdA